MADLPPRTAVAYSTIFSQSAAYPSAWIRGEAVLATRSVRDIEDDKSRTFSETFLVDKDGDGSKRLRKIQSGLSEVLKPVVFDLSPSGSRTLSLKHGGKTDDAPFVHLQSESSSHYVDASEFHGKFVGDTWFGGSSWTSDERFVAYVALAKDPVKPKTSFEDESSTAKSKFDYVEDWGEKYVGVSSLSLHVADTETGRIVTVPGIDTCLWTVGQPVFIPCPTPGASYQLVYTAWSNSPKKLGMIYCYQREAKIFHVDLTQLLLSTETDATSTTAASTATAAPAATPAVTHTCLTNGIKLARSVRFNADGSSMAFLGSKRGFPSHGGCSELFHIHGDTALTSDGGASFCDYSKANTQGTLEPLVGTVGKPKAKGAFPGIFVDQLPRNCFVRTAEGEKVVFSSQWGSVESVVTVSLKTGEVERVPAPLVPGVDASSEWCDPTDFSCSLLDVSGDQLAVSVSSPGCASRLCLLTLPQQQQQQSGGVKTEAAAAAFAPAAAPIAVTRRKAVNPNPPTTTATTATTASATTSTTAADNEAAPKSQSSSNNKPFAPADFTDLIWKVFRYEDDSGLPFESILLLPKSAVIAREKTEGDGASGSGSGSGSGGLPLIVVPHGGPHSCMPTSFIPSYAFLAIHLKAAILHVNYRGSTGFGQDSIESLLGKIGTNDVQDMVFCTQDILKNVKLSSIDSSLPDDPLIDASRVCVVGGSHGGFLSAHLIGQHPDLFKVACMRNPVVNLPAMQAVTDIPDWCFIEALGPKGYDFSSYPSSATEEQLQTMRRCSPIAYFDNVRAPVLMLTGEKDRRVPASQGLSYYHALRAKGIPTKLLMFPEDVHAIDRPLSEAEQWVAIADWINRHLLT